MAVASAPPPVVARSKRTANGAPVAPVPIFAIVALRVTAVPAVADVGVMPPAVRSEGAGATASLIITLHHAGPPPPLPLGPVSVPPPGYPCAAPGTHEPGTP